MERYIEKIANPKGCGRLEAVQAVVRSKGGMVSNVQVYMCGNDDIVATITQLHAPSRVQSMPNKTCFFLKKRVENGCVVVVYGNLKPKVHRSFFNKLPLRLCHNNVYRLDTFFKKERLPF